MFNTTTFTEQTGKITQTLRAVSINATPEELAAFAGNVESMQGGFGGTFQQLENTVRAETFSISRVPVAPHVDLIGRQPRRVSSSGGSGRRPRSSSAPSIRTVRRLCSDRSSDGSG
jgi:hypothetical protein